MAKTTVHKSGTLVTHPGPGSNRSRANRKISREANPFEDRKLLSVTFELVKPEKINARYLALNDVHSGADPLKITVTGHNAGSFLNLLGKWGCVPD